MAEKNNLDNMNGQEIKELIGRNIITLNQLDTSALRKLMNHETDMLCFGKGDLELISKCSELLDESREEFMSDEEFMNIIDNAQKERVVISEKEEKPSVPRIRVILKRTVLVAAAILVIMSGTVAVACGFGVDIYKYVSENAKKPVGTEDNIGNFTFYHSGESKKYSSLEEMVESENLDIMYPTKLPEGVSLDSVQIVKLSNGNQSVQFVTNNTNVNIIIELSSANFESNNTDVVEHNGITYYIDHHMDNNTFLAHCHYDENAYYISATTRDDLIDIIRNMKE